MKKFANIRLRLHKDVKKGDKESLLSLFSVPERFKRMKVLTSVDEGSNIKIILEGLGETDLNLGDDMEKGQQRAIMTLFWYRDRVKPIEMRENAKAGEIIAVNMWKT
jgi:hypothetical protein